MSRRVPIALAVTALSLGLIAPAMAEDGAEFVPVLRQQATHFMCEEPGKAHNATKQVLGPVQWSTAPPTASELSGGGCQSVDWNYDATMGYGPYVGGPVREVASTMTYAGTFTGNLDALTFRQWASSMGDPAGTWPVEFGVKIDGRDVVPFPTKVGGTKVADGLKDVSTVTVHGIGLLAEEDDSEHAIEVSLRYDEPWRSTVWQWGTTQAPSGITFNPGHSAGARIAARD